MTGMEISAALVILELILKHGVPAAISIIKTIESDEPTLQDIIDLKDRIKKPGDYFNEMV